MKHLTESQLTRLASSPAESQIYMQVLAKIELHKRLIGCDTDQALFGKTETVQGQPIISHLERMKQHGLIGFMVINNTVLVKLRD